MSFLLIFNLDWIVIEEFFFYIRLKIICLSFWFLRNVVIINFVFYEYYEKIWEIGVWIYVRKINIVFMWKKLKVLFV